MQQAIVVGARAEPVFEELFHRQFEPMKQFAHLLGADDPENIAQDAFVRLHRRWRHLHDQDKALAYLRRTVANLATSRFRHLRVTRRHPPQPPADVASAESSVLDRFEHSRLWRAVSGLPTRQRQVVVLRYWLDLDVAGVAAVLGISPGTVKAATSHAMDNLRKEVRPR
ncbi:MAG TPA: SigE family RNA polymerase sigma factor [Pseudonocardiaceae bacterium]|nr:SigE family RNA polymerase sigma factor [Pseudonocardiaceae bacterium]